MASDKGIQGGSLVLGVVAGVVLYAIFRHIFYIGIGVVLGVLLVMYVSRRR